MAKGKFIPGQLGLFMPESSWVPPTELPDLRSRPLVAIDSETRDTGIESGRGAGWALGPAGYISGVSWGAEGTQGYAPIRHPDTECFPLENVVRWLDDLFRSGTRIVFHNGPYDIGWFGCHGIAPPVNMEDTLVASVMVDETQREYNLDACCIREGIPGKDERLLREAARAHGVDPKAGLALMPARYSGAYAEQDAVATLQLFGQLEPQLRAQQVWEAYRTEIELIPMVVAMRRRGIRIDTAAAPEIAEHFRTVSREALLKIKDTIGFRREVTISDIRSPQWMANIFSSQGIHFPRTAKTGQGSFQKEWMEKSEHPLPRLASLALTYEEAASKFVENFILGYTHRGRLHSEIHQFLSDDGGTRSHRFSYSEPPLQQMSSPDRDPQETIEINGKKIKRYIEHMRIGKRVRQAFLPEEGEIWAANDYSSQEPRLTVHFAYKAKGRGAEIARDRYIENPRLDYHQMVADMTGQPRPRAKILNLAMTYGKGIASLAEELGVSFEDAKKIMEDYHNRLPFIKSLDTTAKNLANTRGYIRLIDGARIHYNLWESGWLEQDEKRAAIMAGKPMGPCSLEEANLRRADPNHPWSKTKLRRADTRKALNNLVQGSAARQTKLAMLGCWREGILPLIQMHDELGASVADERVAVRMAEIMRDAVKLEVPVVIDTEYGLNWGDAKHTWEEIRSRVA